MKTVLASNDEQWKYFFLQGIVRHASGLALAVDKELTRFALAPTAAELEEGVVEVAREILAAGAAAA